MPWWQFAEFDWDDGNIDHLYDRHRITPEAAEVALRASNDIRRVGRDRYEARCRDEEGHPLFIVFERRRGRVRVISTREP